MLKTGIKGWMLAASLAIAGLAGAATAQAPAAPAATTPTATTGASPATAATAAPTGLRPADANQGTSGGSVQKADAASASPVLAMDGAPAMTVKPMLGQPTDGLMGIQPQVTKNGLRAHWFHDRVLLPLITMISIFVLLLLLAPISQAVEMPSNWRMAHHRVEGPAS